jgi:N-methylhydantoinase B
VNEAELIRQDGSRQRLLKATGVQLAPGDRLSFRTAGGGGWGDPRARDHKEIEQDVVAGFISPEAAKCDYGYPHPDSSPQSAGSGGRGAAHGNH